MFIYTSVTSRLNSNHFSRYLSIYPKIYNNLQRNFRNFGPKTLGPRGNRAGGQFSSHDKPKIRTSEGLGEGKEGEKGKIRRGKIENQEKSVLKFRTTQIFDWGVLRAPHWVPYHFWYRSCSDSWGGFRVTAPENLALRGGTNFRTIPDFCTGLESNPCGLAPLQTVVHTR